MSYQLISGYSGQTPNEEAAVLSILSASDGMPAPLSDYLCELSKELASSLTCSQEPQFCYHIANSHHILSAAVKTETKSGVIHHLVLTADEVAGMQRNAMRPTPAGLILALDTLNLWHTSSAATIPPRPEEPKLTASHLPDATNQQTWKKLTGHKSNVTTLLQPPYNGKCLICTPEHITNKNRLRLIHESMWLTTTRGWGKTFHCFSSAIAGAFKTVEISCATMGSPEEETHRQKETDIPVLTILSSLLPTPADKLRSDTADIRPSTWQVSTPRQAPAEHNTGKEKTITAAPYKYTEAPDYETFDVATPQNRQSRWLKHIAGLFALTTLVYLIVGNYVDFATSTVEDLTLTTTDEQAALHEFAAIIRKGQAADEQLLRLKGTLTPATQPGHEFLFESINLLVSDVYKTEGHQDNLHYLLSHAEVLELQPEELSRYYLLQATRNYPPEEWIAHNTEPGALQGWAKLFAKFPDIKNPLLKDKNLQRYILPIIKASEPK